MAIAPRGLLGTFLEPRSVWSTGLGLFARQSAPAVRERRGFLGYGIQPYFQCSLVPCVELAQRFQVRILKARSFLLF